MSQIDSRLDEMSAARIEQLGFTSDGDRPLAHVLEAIGHERYVAEWLAEVLPTLSTVKCPTDSSLLRWYRDLGLDQDSRVAAVEYSCVVGGRRTLAQTELHLAQAREIDDFFDRRRAGDIPHAAGQAALDLLREAHAESFKNLLFSEGLSRHRAIRAMDRRSRKLAA